MRYRYYLCTSTEFFDCGYLKLFINSGTLLVIDNDMKLLTMIKETNVEKHPIHLADEFELKSHLYESHRYIKLSEEFFVTMQTYLIGEI